MVTPPNLGLPQVIEALDFGLEAGLAWRRKDRHHAQTQAQMNDPAQSTQGGMRALKPRVVVKLSEGRPAAGLPMRRQDREHLASAPRRGRPGLRQAAIEGNRIEDIKRRPAVDHQSLNKIKSVKFRPAGG